MAIIFDAGQFKNLLQKATFDGGYHLNNDVIERIWAASKSNRKGITREDFIAKAVPNIANCLYGNYSADSRCKVWEGLSAIFLVPQTQAASGSGASSNSSLPTNTPVYHGQFLG